MPWVPARGTRGTIFTGITGRTKLTFVSGESGFTQVTGGSIASGFGFMPVVTTVAFRARPSVVTGAYTRAVNA